MQCARVLLSSVDYSDLHYCSTLSHKRHDLRGEGGHEHEKYFLIFPTNLSGTSHSTENLARYLTFT